MSRIKGSKHTEETKRKISKAHLGKTSGMKGKHLSIEARRKISEANSGVIRSKEMRIKMSERERGERGNNWRGGISTESERVRNGIESRLWRESVFARDNWTCQKTGERGVRLNAHHIKNFAKYPELRFAIDNGITLSKEAHEKFHKIYGKENNTKEQLEDFLEKPRC